MEDAAFGIEGFAMTVPFGGGVEALRELVLGLGRYASLIFEDDYMLVVKCIADEGEVIVYGAMSAVCAYLYCITDTYQEVTDPRSAPYCHLL